MRAVNLIPKDYRRGALAGSGGETLSYFLLGGMAVLLVAVLSVVLTSNAISSKKAEVATIQNEAVEAKANADALQAYADFASVQQTRTATVSSLAQSRFDWERTMRELSRVIPSDVSLTALTGSASSESPVEGGSAASTRGSIAGPALTMNGCAPSQDRVAEFISALEDIDGVTRVGLESSGAPTEGGGSSGGAAAAGGTSGGGDSCSAPGRQVSFTVVAGFDAAPVPPADGQALTPSAPAPAPTPEQQGVQQAKDKAEQATNLIPGN